METRVNTAMEKHKNGYNCCQAVVCTYCDLFGVEEQVGRAMSEGFGSGMGGLQETCGAVTAMFMLIGLKSRHGKAQDENTKAMSYKRVKEMANKFYEMNGSIVCKELLGGPGMPKRRSCQGCVEDASRLIEEMLLGEGVEL